MSAAIGYHYALQIQENTRTAEGRRPGTAVRAQKQTEAAPRRRSLAALFAPKAARRIALHS